MENVLSNIKSILIFVLGAIVIYSFYKNKKK